MTPWAWLLWFAMVAASIVQIGRSTVVTDVSSFLPGPADAAQRLMIGQLRDGLSTRILLVGLDLERALPDGRPSPAQTAALAAASRALRARLAADTRFAWVANGDLEALGAERERIFAARYLLHPDIDAAYFSTARLAQAFAELEAGLVSARGALIRPIAPADPTLAALHLAERAARRAAPAGDAGVWLAGGGTAALLLMETRARGDDIAGMRAAIDAARGAATAVLAQWPAGLAAPAVAFAGAGYFNVRAHDAIGQDAEQLALAALALVATLLVWALRSPRFLALVVLPVGSGALAGYAAVGAAAGTIHGITLAFGITLIGEAVDYAIYTCVQADERGAHDARFWRRVYLAALTSLVGFAAMAFSGFAGLAQLGLFSMVGLTVAVLCTRWLLPPLLPRVAAAAGDDRFAWLPALCRRLRAWRGPVLVAAAGACALLAARHPAMWQDSLDALSASSPAENARDARYRDGAGVPDLRLMVSVHGADLEAALERAEAAARVLDALVRAGRLDGYDSPADLVPSRALQRARQAALPAPEVLRERVAAALAGRNLKPQAFEPFIAEVAASRARPPLTVDTYAGTVLGAWLAAQIVRSDDGVTVLILPRGAAAPAALRDALAAARLPGVALIDLKGDVETLVAQYRQRAMTAALAGTVLIFVLLAAQLRRARAVGAMIATIVATVALTAAALLLLRGQLTVFNLVSLLLVVGVVSNYTLFFSTLSPAPAERQRASVSVLLAAASTFFGFAALAFSATPVLAAIGQTVALGAAAGFAVSMVFSVEADAPR
ncbi:MAG: MMPL family transporter [Burkholderiales bacterium]|nr:MMPL family transporter [Burkholderiales bacterium]